MWKLKGLSSVVNSVVGNKIANRSKWFTYIVTSSYTNMTKFTNALFFSCMFPSQQAVIFFSFNVVVSNVG